MDEPTSGPWIATGKEGPGEYFTDVWYVDGGRNESVATVRGKANAPFHQRWPGHGGSALEALIEEYVESSSPWDPEIVPEIIAARAAIAKAKGD